MASVKVAVRLRPMNNRELEMESDFIISMDGKKTSITNNKITAIDRGQGQTNSQERTKDFTFDHSYWTVDKSDLKYASQDQVFKDLGSDVISNAFEGYNVCVFAYGQTGSGKSYTMMGDNGEESGLIPRICEGLFSNMKNNKDAGTTYRTEVSYLEIYNERVRDLLRSSNSGKNEAVHTLRVREHPKNGPYVQDLSSHLVMDYRDIKELMDRGNSVRTTASTNMNDVSSRSHAIFTMKFTQAKFSKNMPSETQSKIHLVDLAGSERADATGATGQRLKEGASINKSLVTLGNVISILADISKNRGKPIFIPYRDSVLTWLLKDSLGGNSKTIMIATISPADCNYSETLSTLRYANRAKDIINKPTINEDPNVKLIRELRAEIARLKTLLGGNIDKLVHPQVQEKLHESEARMKVLTDEWAGKWKDANSLLEEGTIAMRREGTGLLLDSELPHLIGIDDDILSTGIMLYHLKEGVTSIGRADADRQQDIVLSGLEVEMEHCAIEHQDGEVLLIPNEGSSCIVNGTTIQGSTRLYQGAVILLGKTNMFRFNHPAEAAKLRQEGIEGQGGLSRHVSRVSLLSRSMTDLAWSTENLSSPSHTGAEIQKLERKHKEELEKLEHKRQEIAEMEDRHREAEEKRVAEEQSKELEIEENKKLLEQLQHETESIKAEALQAHQRVKLKEDILKRRSMDIEKQFKDYLEEKEKFQVHQEVERLKFQDEKEKENKARELERLEMEREKEEMQRLIEEEALKVAEQEDHHRRQVEDARMELIQELDKLEKEKEIQQQSLDQERRRLEDQERRNIQALLKAEAEIKKKKQQLKTEKEQELSCIEQERQKLKELKREQEQVVRNSGSHLEIHQHYQELGENEKLLLSKYKTLTSDAQKRKADAEESLQKQTVIIERDEQLLQQRESTFRTDYDDANMDDASESDKSVYNSKRDAIIDGKERMKKMKDDLWVQQKEVDHTFSEEMSSLEKMKKIEWEEIARKKLELEAKDTLKLKDIEKEIESKNKLLQQRQTKLAEDEKLLDELEQSHKFSVDEVQEEKQKLENEKLVLADLERKQLQNAEIAYENISRKQSILERKDEEEINKIEEQKKRLALLEEEHNLDGNEQVQLQKIKEVETLKLELEEQQRKFEEERQAELDKIEMEKYHLEEMENQERINELVEQEVKRRVFEEKVAIEKKRRIQREREKRDRENEIKKIRKAHDREILHLKRQFHNETIRESAVSPVHSQTPSHTRSNPYATTMSHSTSSPHIASPNTDISPIRSNRSSSSASRRSVTIPAQNTLGENPIIVTVPMFTMRGYGMDTHHEFEVKVTIGNEVWSVFRRYKKFRELHLDNKLKFPEVAALEFPPKKWFGTRTEKFVLQRKTDLENYIQNFINVVRRNPTCVLHPSNSQHISKQTLCDFAPFFKKGVFETSKYGTG